MNELEEAAELAGVTWCDKWECAYKGALEAGTVHFARPQRYNKRRLWDFLYLAWYSKHIHALVEEHGKAERWWFRYLRCRWMQNVAADMHKRMSRSLFEYDRAKLREELSEYADRVPAYARPVEYSEAKQWAR